MPDVKATKISAVTMSIEFAINLIDLKDLDLIDSDGSLNLESLGSRLNPSLAGFLSKNFGSIKINRVYWGSEFCEFLTPTQKQLAGFLDKVAQRNFAFTYTTSYLTTKNEAAIKENLIFLNKECPNAEVIINDFGLMNYWQEQHFNLWPVVGRLLLKMKNYPYTDPTITPDLPAFLPVDLNEVINNQKDFYNSLPVLDIFYKYLGKSILFELDKANVLLGLDDANRAHVNFHIPWTYMTCGRNCLIAREKDGKFSFSVKACPKYCQNEHYLFNCYDNLVQMGNVVYQDNLDQLPEYNGLNRLIITLF